MHRLVLLEKPEKAVLVFLDHIVDLLYIREEVDGLRLLVLEVVFSVQVMPINFRHFLCCKLNVKNCWVLPNVELFFAFVVKFRLLLLPGVQICGKRSFSQLIHVSDVVVGLRCDRFSRLLNCQFIVRVLVNVPFVSGFFVV